jgi:insecticidal toxin complex protein TccC
LYSYKNDSLAAKKEPRKSAHGDANTEYSPPSLKDIAKNTVKDFRYFNAKDVTEFMGGIRELRGQRYAHAIRKAEENISNYKSIPFPLTLSKIANIVSNSTKSYQADYVKDFSGSGMNPTRTGLTGVPVRGEKEWFQPVLEHDADNNEIVFRTMSEADYAHLLSEGKLTGTSETSISPAIAYSLKYNGVLVQFTVKPGTWAKIREIALVTNKEELNFFPDLSFKKGDWLEEHAKLKKESNQITTQVGKGKALKIFNDNIIGFQRIERVNN